MKLSFPYALLVALLFVAPASAELGCGSECAENNNATDAASAVSDRQTIQGIERAMSGRTVIGHRQLWRNRGFVGEMRDKLQDVIQENKDRNPTDPGTDGDQGQIE